MPVTALVVVNGVVTRDHVILALVHRVAPPSPIRKAERSACLGPEAQACEVRDMTGIGARGSDVRACAPRPLAPPGWFDTAWRASRCHGRAGGLPDRTAGAVGGQTCTGRRRVGVRKACCCCHRALPKWAVSLFLLYTGDTSN